MSAGVGVRLDPLTKAVPKPLVPVCNMPIMQYNISLLKKYNICDITANLHYFPEQIEDYFKDGSQFGVQINYSYEKKLLGTAGGVLNMAKMNPPKSSTFIVLSSDVLTGINLSKLIAFHKKKKAIATIALVEVPDPSEYGVVVLDKEDRICAFQEKPSKKDALSRLVNTGIYIFDKKILDIISKKKYFDFGKEVFPCLVEQGLPFYGYKISSYWKDIGNPKNYISANFDAADQAIVVGKKCVIDENVVFKGRVIVGDECRIKKGTRISNSIIWRETAIGKNVKINSSIIGNWCNIEDDAIINKNCIIANRCTIKSKTVLPPDTKLSPGTNI